MAILELNFQNQAKAQDMIKIIQKEKGLSASEAIDFSINMEICTQILEAGWASFALSVWGHGDPEREWSLLDNPFVATEIGEEKAEMISKVESKEGVDTETAITYFLLFTMETLGYHI